MDDDPLIGIALVGIGAVVICADLAVAAFLLVWMAIHG